MPELLMRNTKMAVMLEDVSGIYKDPGNADFLPILDASSTTPGYDVRESKEITSGLDRRPGRPSMQTGEVTVAVYLKAGAAGGLPHYDALLQTVLSAPAVRAAKTVTGAATLAAIVADPAPTTTVFVIAVATVKLLAGDHILVDVSADGSGDYALAEVLTAVFDVDKQTVTLVAPLSAAPVAANCIQLVSRIAVGGTPGYVPQDVILVDVSDDQDAAVVDECLVLSASGEATQSVAVWPYLSAEPLHGASVFGGRTYVCRQSGQPTVTVTEFDDCDAQDGVRFDYAGCRLNMTMESVEVGAEAELHFSGQASQWRISDSGTSLATLGLTPNTGPEHHAPLCLGMEICIGDRRSALDLHNFSLDMGCDIARHPSMRASSGMRGTFYRQRGVNGSFTFDMQDAAQYRAWVAGETTALFLRWHDANQVIVLMIPYIKAESLERGDQDGVRTITRNWMADVRQGIGPMALAFFMPPVAPA